MYSCLLCFILAQQGRKHTDIHTSVKFPYTLNQVFLAGLGFVLLHIGYYRSLNAEDAH